jgi:hypothetical protein
MPMFYRNLLRPFQQHRAHPEWEDDGVDVSAWDGLNLSPETFTALSKMKFSSPSARHINTVILFDIVESRE